LAFGKAFPGGNLQDLDTEVPPILWTP
jgi:hypothetical protein